MSLFNPIYSLILVVYRRYLLLEENRAVTLQQKCQDLGITLLHHKCPRQIYKNHRLPLGITSTSTNAAVSTIKEVILINNIFNNIEVKL